MAEHLTSETLSSRHGFFTRQGGVSSGVYASLQCGWGAKNDARENVVENRKRVAGALGAEPDGLLSVFQVHSARCETVAAPWAPEQAPRADAMATRQPGLALGVLSADCAPVLFEDAETGVVGAAHAGWRGALDGVLEATIDAMTALGARADRIRAVIGPCIGPANYEVGPEYVARFVEHDPANARFFERSGADGKALFDLPGYALSRLSAAGIAEARWIGRCTYAEPELFYSNRGALHRSEPDYGRLISAIQAPAAA